MINTGLKGLKPESCQRLKVMGTFGVIVGGWKHYMLFIYSLLVATVASVVGGWKNIFSSYIVYVTLAGALAGWKHQISSYLLYPTL